MQVPCLPHDTDPRVLAGCRCVKAQLTILRATTGAEHVQCNDLKPPSCCDIHQIHQCVACGHTVLLSPVRNPTKTLNHCILHQSLSSAASVPGLADQCIFVDPASKIQSIKETARISKSHFIGSSRLPPWEAPIMIAEKRFFFVFFHTSLGLKCMTAYLLLPCPDLRWSGATGGGRVHDCLPASAMPRSAVVQSDRGGGAAGVAVAPHHAVHLIKQPKEASVQSVFWLFWNVLY